MTMNKALVFALLALSTAVTAQAQVYQWKDSTGKTVISDTPPPSSVKDKRTLGERRPAASSEPVADPKTEQAKEAPKGPPTMAEKDMEFRKRQQEAREKAEKKAKEDAQAKEKRDTCDRARANLAALESQGSVAQYNARGEATELDAGQRQAEIERTRRIMQEACK